MFLVVFVFQIAHQLINMVSDNPINIELGIDVVYAAFWGQRNQMRHRQGCNIKIVDVHISSRSVVSSTLHQ